MSRERLLRMLPAIGRLLNDPAGERLARTYSRPLVSSVADEIVEELRSRLSRDELSEDRLRCLLDCLFETVEERIRRRLALSLIPVINATGVIIFTNGGRAPLLTSAVAGMTQLAGHYTNLEYDLRRGVRGHRDLHFEERIKRLLACEAGTVCNNAAAALLLILNTLASGRKVLVSRGELIEIGGSFRLPDVMEKSGAKLREVGTTNRTRASDYADAIDEETALILTVHPSNYRIVGFTQQARLEDLVPIARRAGIPLAYDIGSGYLFRTPHQFLNREPTVAESLEAGADLICFSGDKLLGGPQAGIVVGRKDLVEKVRRNPLMRALRVDKLIYSALERTLVEYERNRFQQTLPIWRMMNLSPGEIRERAESVISELGGSSKWRFRLEEGFSVTGGGSAPEERIPTWLLAVESPSASPNRLEEALRLLTPPILARIENQRVVLDLRTVDPDQDQFLIAAFESLSL